MDFEVSETLQMVTRGPKSSPRFRLAISKVFYPWAVPVTPTQEGENLPDSGITDQTFGQGSGVQASQGSELGPF